MPKQAPKSFIRLGPELFLFKLLKSYLTTIFSHKIKFRKRNFSFVFHVIVSFCLQNLIKKTTKRKYKTYQDYNRMIIYKITTNKIGPDLTYPAAQLPFGDPLFAPHSLAV